MANVKISGLPEASAGTVLNTDTIVGVFNGITKKCELSSINLDLLSDGTNYKRISATKATKINGGTFSEDDLADGTSYKRIQAAKADALNTLGSLIANYQVFVKGNASGLEYHKGYYSAKVITFAPDGYPTSGANVSYTGIGFKPSRMIVLGAGSNGHESRGEVYNAPDGGLSTLLADTVISDYSKTGTVFVTNSLTLPNAICAYLYNNVDTDANYIFARPVSFDADGFTIAWYTEGSLNATFNFYFIPIR